jgi:protein SCO1/2
VPRVPADRRARILAVGALVLAVAVGDGAAHEPADRAPIAMDFVPPPAGSYVLHEIMPAPAGVVLDPAGRRLPLSRFTAGKITLLGFMYTSCADPRGCPLADLVFQTVRHRVAEQPELRERVRLVSLSFDPRRDTPSTMRRYASRIGDNGVEWAFLTTERPRTLVPLLDGFGQDVRMERDGDGRAVGPFAHTLKVFLLDPAGMVREIYTTSYLFPDVIVNDMETLRRGMERR